MTTQTLPIDPTDEQILTAYALGELRDADVKTVEAHLAIDASAREFVAQIRATATDLSSALAAEPAQSLTLPQRAAILATTDAMTVKKTDGAKGRAVRQRILAMAACAALATAGWLAISRPTHSRSQYAISGYAPHPTSTETLAYDQNVIRMEQRTQNRLMRPDAIVNGTSPVSPPPANRYWQPSGAVVGRSMRSLSDDSVLQTGTRVTAEAAAKPRTTPESAREQKRLEQEGLITLGRPTVPVPDGGKLQLGGQDLSAASRATGEPGAMPNASLAMPGAPQPGLASGPPGQQAQDARRGVRQNLSTGGVVELRRSEKKELADQMVTHGMAGDQDKKTTSTKTNQSKNTEVVTRTYDIRDIVVSTPDFENAPTFDLSAANTKRLPSGGDGGKNPAPPASYVSDLTPTVAQGPTAFDPEIGQQKSLDDLIAKRDNALKAGRTTDAEAVAKEIVAFGDRTERERRFLAEPLQAPDQAGNTESYARIYDNPFLTALQNPLSTFSIDVDTASYANVRRFLTGGQLPPADAVRIEEMVNYFPYDYPQPDGDAPFASNVEVAVCPWAPEHRLVRVGLHGREVSAAEKEKAKNLVFLIDVSGSMQPANKLPLLRESMKMLVRQLGPQDKVTLAVYAGSSGLVLPPTTVGGANQDIDARIKSLWNENYAPKIVTINGKPANMEQLASEYAAEAEKMRAAAVAVPAPGRDAILASIDRLEAGGSTNGAAGITLAYEQAQSAFIKDGVNRVILCTDGDFNVGVTNEGDLTRMIEEKAKSGVFLSVLGFGMGNVKDSTMEKLADKGNGNYAYIDTLAEAKKTLVDQMSGTLVTIAKDVKIQIEFNPAKVSSYRLIGYENRMLAKEDFNDDKKDAGEIGAGHTVTALYEVVPAGVKRPTTQPGVDPLKYQKNPEDRSNYLGEINTDLLTLKLRYKAPDAPLEQGTSKLLEFPVKDDGKPFEAASKDFKFASAVAAFGMILRDSPYKGSASLGAVAEIAFEAKGEDKSGYRGEFFGLVKKAQALKGGQ